MGKVLIGFSDRKLLNEHKLKEEGTINLVQHLHLSVNLKGIAFVEANHALGDERKAFEVETLRVSTILRNLYL